VEEGRRGDRILEIEVRGKRGVGYCKSTPSAVMPYERLLNRPKYVPQGKARERARNPRPPVPPTYPQPSDPVFPGNHIKLFNRLLAKSSLKLDPDGKPRTAYSLRHTYILADGRCGYSFVRLGVGNHRQSEADNLQNSPNGGLSGFSAHGALPQGCSIKLPRITESSSGGPTNGG
jgi:hypothetical protein